jgi:hypothetical protein
VRSISSAIALPAAGWIVAATGSYRALFALGGIATLVALLPFVRFPRPRGRLLQRRPGRHGAKPIAGSPSAAG